MYARTHSRHPTAERFAGGAKGSVWGEQYYLAWPDGRDRLAWPDLTYWCIVPVWARYSDYDCVPPLIAEFGWPSPASVAVQPRRADIAQPNRASGHFQH